MMGYFAISFFKFLYAEKFGNKVSGKNKPYIYIYMYMYLKEFERVYAKLVCFWEGELYLSIHIFLH